MQMDAINIDSVGLVVYPWVEMDACNISTRLDYGLDFVHEHDVSLLAQYYVISN
jgi:hypothetical protein